MAALAVVLALRAVPADPRATGGAAIDGAGALLAQRRSRRPRVGVDARHRADGLTAAAAAALVAAGVALLGAFVVVERRQGAAAMMPLTLFASRPFVGLTLLLYGALGALTVLPALLVIAIGMAGAVAPLTTGVLGAVDAQLAGAASGFNSAVARGGGLIATALLGGALAATGEPLLSALHVAAMLSALACMAAASSAFMLYRG